ncbi:MAG: hypothetical protein ACJ72M_14355, partial [Propionibacteriaceae bacterium]
MAFFLHNVPFGASDTTMGIHAMIDVRFVYMTGQRRRAFRNARLAGSWNSWADIPMAEIVAEDGCLAFAATVS